MKKIAFFSLLCLSLSFGSCGLFELDNYDAPGETLQGEVVDVLTGDRILTDQGSEGIRVRLRELSWSEDATFQDFNCKPDGTFQNTKLFEGTYRVQVDGPFIPLVRTNTNDIPLADESQTVKISGVTKVKFEVEPFLNVEWVSDPTVSNGQITAKVKVTRGVSAADFQEKIEPMGNWSASFLNMTDIQLFVSYSSSVGYRARDERWSSKIEYSGNYFESHSLFGQPVTIQSNGSNPIPSGRTVYVRAAARINYETASVRRWNYSEPIEVFIP